jgi:TRAP-type C4-dicarboxylate transport system permease small subunit
MGDYSKKSCSEFHSGKRQLTERLLTPRIDTLIDRISSAASRFATLLLAAMTAAVVYEVIMRNIFNAPTVWSVEYTGYAMAWLGLFGAAEVLRRDEHVGIHVLTDRLPGRAWLAADIFANATVAATAIWLTYTGVLWTFAAYRIAEVSDTVLQTPQVYVRVAFPLGMALVAVVSVARIVGRLRLRSEHQA